MKREGLVKAILGQVCKFFVFFLLVAFVTTCCILLFSSSLAESLGIVYTSENISRAAKLTMLNSVILSLVFYLIDTLRRRYTVKLPTKRIAEATARMIEGDFSVRIKPISRYAADESFNEIINSINRMAEELSGVETLRSDFIASVSHEMKTPLTVIKNYAVLLGSESLTDEERIEYSRRISESAARLADMMTNILRLNRLENQRIYPKGEKYILADQLAECIILFEESLEQKGIELEVELDDALTILEDKELLSLVFNNLLSNACKFTDPGGRVTVTLTKEGERAVVRVKDTGIGMSESVGAHIFEKFYQGDESRASSGNGLGLALVKRVVDITGAEIAVDSMLGVGTTFTVRIPIYEADKTDN